MKCPLTDEEIGEIIRDSAGAMSEVKAIATAAYRKALEWASIRAVEVHDEVRFVREDRGDVGDEANEIIDIIRAKLAEMEED